MKIIIDCPPEHYEAAVKIVTEELTRYDRYTKVGWGWSFGNYQTGPRFFVRRLKDGLSCRHLK